MLIAYEKGRKPSDYRVIAGFRNEIIMLYEILCPPRKEESKMPKDPRLARLESRVLTNPSAPQITQKSLMSLSRKLAARSKPSALVSKVQRLRENPRLAKVIA